MKHFELNVIDICMIDFNNSIQRPVVWGNLSNYIFLYPFIFLKVTTVKVSNVSLQASQRDLKEFFSFSGDIVYVEMQKYVYVFQCSFYLFMYHFLYK